MGIIVILILLVCLITSVPIAISTIPLATATADPELDPHGLYSLFKKCFV